MFPPGGGVKVVKIDHNYIVIKDFSRFFETFLNSSSETFFETFWMRHFWDILNETFLEIFWVRHFECYMLSETFLRQFGWDIFWDILSETFFEIFWVRHLISTLKKIIARHEDCFLRLQHAIWGGLNMSSSSSSLGSSGGRYLVNIEFFKHFP